MKRILTLFMVLTLLTLPGIPIEAAETKEADFTFLKAVGILDEGFKPETFYVSRGEAAMLLVRVAGISATEDACVFSDVAASDAYAAEIATAYKLGHISGFGDGTFHPKQSVTVNQMVKILVSLLGYGQKAEALGGYPSGYAIVANQKELTKKLSASGDAPLGYADMTVLLYNALNATVAEGASVEDGYVEYTDTGVSVLRKWHGIQRTDGEVTANYLVSVASDRTVRQGEVAIDGKVYAQGKTNASALLCRRVEAYVHVDTETILHIMPHVNSEVITIDTAKIVKADKSAVTYEKDDKEVTVSVAGAKLIKNGTLFADWTGNELWFDNGRIQLVSSADGAVSYIIAEAYANRLVDYVSLTDKTVYFKDGTSLVVDTDDTGKKTEFIEATGFPADLKYCYPWDVFSVMEGENVLKIIRSEKFIMGKIDEISSDSIVIDGVEYALASDFPVRPTTTQPVLGMEADFYFDYTNALAAIDTAHTKSGTYGILVGINTKGSLDPQTQLRIYTDSAEMKGFEVAEKVRLNGTSIPEADLTASGSPVYSGINVIRQLVAFKLNGAGEIAEINTAQDYTLDPDSDGRLSCFSRDVYIDENRYTSQQPYAALAYQYENSESFGRKYLARPTTKIFQLPPEGAADDAYKMMEYTSLPGGSEATALKNVSLFDVDANYHIGAIVWEKTDTATVPSHPNSRMFVTKTYKGLDAEGATAYFIEGYNESGAAIKLMAEDGMTAFFGKALTNPALDNPNNFEVDPLNPTTWPTDYTNANIYMNGKNKHVIPATEIKPGDMIGYLALGNGEATLLNIVARGTAAPEIELNYDSYYYDLSRASDVVFGGGHCYVISCGRVKSRIAESFVMETTGRLTGQTFIRAYPNAGATLLYDSAKGTTRKISLSEMQVGDKVMVWARTSDILFKVVIR